MHSELDEFESGILQKASSSIHKLMSITGEEGSPLRTVMPQT
jgi:hypothetical protein